MDALAATAAGRPLRVLHVLEATLGGTRRYLEAIGAANGALGAEMGLAYATGRCDASFQESLRQLVNDGWQPFRVEMRRAPGPSDLVAIWQLRQVLRRFRPDVVHCHSSKAGGVGRLAAATLRGRPATVYSPHALAVNLGRRYLSIERWLDRWTDLHVAVSHSEAEEIRQAGLGSSTRREVVYLCLGLDRFEPTPREPAREQLDLGPGPLIVGVGRLTYQKNPVAFVETVAVVRRSIPEVRALWVGDGELRKAMGQSIESHGLAGSIVVTGWKTDVKPYIAAADVLLSTSRYEGFSYVPVEAMAMGRPVVGSSVTGTVDLLKGALEPLRFPEGDPEQAGRRVVELLRDRRRAEEFAALGLEQVRRRFSPQAMAISLDRAYALALANRERGRTS